MRTKTKTRELSLEEIITLASSLPISEKERLCQILIDQINSEVTVDAQRAVREVREARRGHEGGDGYHESG